MIGIACENHKEALESLVDSAMTIPEVNPMFLPSLEVIPMQLFAYYVALMRGCDIDKPRNLAKSVTVNNQIENTRGRFCLSRPLVL